MRGRHADEFGRNGSRRRLELGTNDSLDVVDADENVLGLEIRVDDTALAVHVVEPEENLLGDLLADVLGDAAMVISLDQA